MVHTPKQIVGQQIVHSGDFISPMLNMRDVYIESIKRLKDPLPSIKLDSWPIWNDFTGGFRPREFTILCGATGIGKTTFLANLSTQLLSQGTRHFVMSVETGYCDYMTRIMSVIAGEDLNTGEPISPERLAQIHIDNEHMLEADTIEFSLYEDRCSVEQLMRDIKYVVAEKGCKIAMIDNLNFFMEVTTAANSVIEMDRVIHELIIFCKQVDVHLIMVMHPKKTENGRVESEFDIKGSSTAVQEAHNVFLFNKFSKEVIQVGGKNQKVVDDTYRELTIRKMRRRGSHVGRSIRFKNEGTRYKEETFV